MRFRPVLLAVLLALLVPGSAQAAGVYVSSQRDNTANAGITGLISLSDSGGEFQAVNTGGFRITGTGLGPIVYSSGVIKQYNGAGGYTNLVTSAGSSVKSMTVAGLGLVVADGDTLKLRSGSTLTPALSVGNPSLPGGKLPGGDQWVSITTLPNGNVVGWSFNNGYGKIWDINLNSGAVSAQDYSISPSTSPFLNNRDAAQQYYGAPVFNSGGIAADGQGGVWAAAAGVAGPNQPSDGNSLYYAPPGTLSFSQVTGAGTFTNPQIAAAGNGDAYVTNADGSASPFFSDVYKVKPDGTTSLVTSAGGNLTDSRIDSITVDRCYTSCSVSGPDVSGPGVGGGAPPPAGGGGGTQGAGSTGTSNTGKTSSPLTAAPTSASVTSKGLSFKLKCATACTVSVSGSLAYGNASAAASTKLATKKVSLKGGKTSTVVLKLSKSQRKAIKKAKKRKRKVTAKLKVKVTPKGGKATTRSLKLKVK